MTLDPGQETAMARDQLGRGGGPFQAGRSLLCLNAQAVESKRIPHSRKRVAAGRRQAGLPSHGPLRVAARDLQPRPPRPGPARLGLPGPRPSSTRLDRPGEAAARGKEVHGGGGGGGGGGGKAMSDPAGPRWPRQCRVRREDERDEGRCVRRAVSWVAWSARRRVESCCHRCCRFDGLGSARVVGGVRRHPRASASVWARVRNRYVV